MSAILTLIASLLSFYGISEIYNGKKEESKTKSSKGIFFFGLGVLGIGLLNPIFESTLLSIISTLVFSGVSIGLIAHTFLNTHAEETIIHAEIETNFDDENQINDKQQALTYTEKPNSTPIPVTFNNQKEMVIVKNNLKKW